MTRAEKAEHWKSLLQEQSASGLSGADFCRERKLEIKRFYWWKRRLGKSGPERAPRRGFVELRTGIWPLGLGSGVSIHLDGRTSIRVERGFDPATLKAVLAAVGEGVGR